MTDHVEVPQWRPVIQSSSEVAPDFTWGPPDADGLRHPVPLVGTPVERGGITWPSREHLDAHVAALRRELDGVERRTEHVRSDADLFPNEWRTEEQRARTLHELDNTAAAIRAELERLGAIDARKRKRR